MFIDGVGAGERETGADAPFRPSVPRITRDLERHRGTAIVDAAGRLLFRGRGQLAVIFALLMALSVALAYANRPQGELRTAPAVATTINGLAATMPRPPADGLGPAAPGELDMVDDVDPTTSAEPPSDPAVAAPGAGPSSSISTTSTTEGSSSTPSVASTDAPGPTTAVPASSTSIAPAPGASTSTSTTVDRRRATTTTTEPTKIGPPTVGKSTSTSLRSPNLVAGGGFERPLVKDGQWALVDSPTWQAAGPIEIWGTGHNGVTSYAGRQHLELNADGPLTIRQKFEVEPGATYTWSFAHRGRDDVDTVEVLVDERVVATVSTRPGAWAVVRGEVRIGRGQRGIVLGLRAVDGGSKGNLIDAVRFERTG